MTRLLRHPVPHPVDPAEYARALWDTGEDLFWLDGGPTGSSYLGTGRSVRGIAALADFAAATPRRPSEQERQGSSFRLGLIGWIPYSHAQRTLGVESRHSTVQDAGFIQADRAVAVSNATGAAELLALADEPRQPAEAGTETPTQSPARADAHWSGDAGEWRRRTLARLQRVARVPASRPTPSGSSASATAATSTHSPTQAPTPRWRDSKDEYLAKIHECQERIRAGDAYVLCLTSQASLPGEWDPLDTFLALRSTNPSHHSALLRIGGTVLVSASPERFLSVTAEGTVSTHPIKGTRPRSSDPVKDLELAEELRTSVKERAENLMIVDLMRNDLTRICTTGSVAVPALFEVESYPHVHQLVSTVTGSVRPECSTVNVLDSLFPAGSMTGAPKRSAVQILDVLEEVDRGLYSGVFGVFGYDGSADLAMTIRSIVITDTEATIGAGGGITALSIPEEEYEEMLLKAAPLVSSLRRRSEEARS